MLSGGAYIDPYPGDLIFADVDNDGRLDIVSPIGMQLQSSSNIKFPGIPPAYISTYAVYRNTTSVGAASLTFAAPVLLPNPSFNSNKAFDFGTSGPNGSFQGPMDPNLSLAIGDIDGDGLADFIRQADPTPSAAYSETLMNNSPLTAYPYTAMSGLNAWTWSNGAFVQKTITNPSPAYATVGFWAHDLDGDGIAELVRDEKNPNSIWTYLSNASSPTMNGLAMTTPGAVTQQSSALGNRIFADFNGDGLTDFYFYPHPALKATAYRIRLTSIPAGAFTSVSATLVPPPWAQNTRGIG